jgi:hypothetical protein
VSKRKKEGKHDAPLFDKARDELFSQIRRCGVLQATEDQRDAWFKETMEYMAKRYPGVTEEDLAQLSELGRRYCEPVTPYGGDNGEDSRGSN